MEIIMALIVDIVLLAILALCVFFGWKNGLIKTLGGFLSYVVSFAIANAVHKFIVPYVQKIPFLANMITENAAAPEFAPDATFFDKLKTLFAFIADDVIKNGNTDASKAVFNNCLAEILTTVISFAGVFIAALLLIKLVFFILDKFVKKIPVIKQANGLLGAVAGLLNGFIWTWGASNIFIKFLFPILHYIKPDVFAMEFADSFVLSICTKINPITYLFWLINLFS